MKIQNNHVRIVLSAAILVLGGTAARAATTVNLGTAANYIILSETGVSTTAGTKVVGNIGVSPIAGTAITGFGLTQTKPTYATSSMVTGKVFAASYAAPTPAHLTTAIGDMTRAYDSAAARKNPNHSELGAGNIGGMTLKPGLYKWSSSVTIPSNVTLSGSQYGIWIFQIAGTLNMSAGKKVILTGGAAGQEHCVASCRCDDVGHNRRASRHRAGQNRDGAEDRRRTAWKSVRANGHHVGLEFHSAVNRAGLRGP